ncbi:MAG: hypothetical protein ABEK59_04825 [Halobacteria archaeon]
MVEPEDIDDEEKEEMMDILDNLSGGSDNDETRHVDDGAGESDVGDDAVETYELMDEPVDEQDRCTESGNGRPPSRLNVREKGGDEGGDFEDSGCAGKSQPTDMFKGEHKNSGSDEMQDNGITQDNDVEDTSFDRDEEEGLPGNFSKEPSSPGEYVNRSGKPSDQPSGSSRDESFEGVDGGKSLGDSDADTGASKAGSEGTVSHETGSMPGTDVDGKKRHHTSDDKEFFTSRKEKGKDGFGEPDGSDSVRGKSEGTGFRRAHNDGLDGREREERKGDGREREERKGDGRERDDSSDELSLFISREDINTKERNKPKDKIPTVDRFERLDTQDKLGFDHVTKEGYVVTDNGDYVALVEIEPIPWLNKTGEERMDVFDVYKEVIRGLEFPVYIASYPKKFDLDRHLDRVVESQLRAEGVHETPLMKYQREVYIQWCKKVIRENGVKDRSYYVKTCVGEEDIINDTVEREWLTENTRIDEGFLDNIKDVFGYWGDDGSDVDIEEAIKKELRKRQSHIESAFGRVPELTTGSIDSEEETKRILYYFYNNKVPQFEFNQRNFVPNPGSSEVVR